MIEEIATVFGGTMQGYITQLNKDPGVIVAKFKAYRETLIKNSEVNDGDA